MAMGVQFGIFGEHVLLSQCSIGWTGIDDGECRGCAIQ